MPVTDVAPVPGHYAKDTFQSDEYKRQLAAKSVKTALLVVVGLLLVYFWRKR